MSSSSGLWPGAKRALEFAWKEWDADRDGLIEGRQHNTYDIEFFGPNPMMGTLYLGALLAGERLARVVGDEAAAAEYRRVFDSGRAKLDQELWRDGFYIQHIPDAQACGQVPVRRGLPDRPGARPVVRARGRPRARAARGPRQAGLALHLHAQLQAQLRGVRRLPPGVRPQRRARA